MYAYKKFRRVYCCTIQYRFKEHEEAKIRQEIENKLRFELIAKEKDILDSYNEQVNLLKAAIKSEKEIWENKKLREEENLNALRRQLEMGNLPQEIVNAQIDSKANTRNKQGLQNQRTAKISSTAPAYFISKQLRLVFWYVKNSICKSYTKLMNGIFQTSGQN